MEYNYNEIEYAKLIYEKGIQNINFLPTELRLVATYLRRNLNLKPKEMKEKLYEWCETKSGIKDFKIEKYYKILNKAINQAIKKGSCLIEIKNINIYEHELNYINNLKIDNKYEYECKKLMFTLLCKAKLNMEITKQKNNSEDIDMSIYFKGGTKKYNDLKKEANIPQKIKINEEIIYELSKYNLITPMFNGLIVLDFIKNINEINIQDKKEVINIKYFENFGYYYDFYNGIKGIKQCEICGKLIRIKSKTCPPKYCKECAKKIDKEDAVYRMRKHREKENVTKV